MNGNILCLAKALPQESLVGLELSGSVHRAFNPYTYTRQMAVPVHSTRLSKSVQNRCYVVTLNLCFPYPHVLERQVLPA